MKEQKELTFRPKLIAKGFKRDCENACTEDISQNRGKLAIMLEEPTRSYVQRMKEMAKRREEMAKKMIKEKEVREKLQSVILKTFVTNTNTSGKA